VPKSVSVALHIMADAAGALAHRPRPVRGHRGRAAREVVSAVMERLCGRPGCSERASVAYGMRAEDLVFWLDVLSGDDNGVGGVLCRRHADSMVVPRGWTLDDLRDPDLHLFRPPPASPRTRPARAARRVNGDETGEQLRLEDDVIAAADADVVRSDVVAHTPVVAEELVVPADGAAGGDADARDQGPWTPSFDEADDLDGLLSARSPLLSRAFRTADRHDE